MYKGILHLFILVNVFINPMRKLKSFLKIILKRLNRLKLKSTINRIISYSIQEQELLWCLQKS